LTFHSGRLADHSPPSNVEIKECVELYLHSPIRLHGEVLRGSTGNIMFLCSVYCEGKGKFVPVLNCISWHEKVSLLN
jgi:hypothetical protein